MKINEYGKDYYQNLIGRGKYSRKDYRIPLLIGLKKLLKANLSREALILDIACGDGFYVNALDNLFQVMGGDISRLGIKYKKQKIYQGDVRKLPFRDDFFDCVLAIDILEHIRDTEEALKEISRVLKLNGLLIISTPNGSSFGRKIKGDEWFGYRDKTHVTMLCIEDWRKKILGMKFRIIKDGTDILWDTPYPILIPAIIQNYLRYITIWILRTTIIFLPWKWGENYYAVCIKSKK